MSTWIRQFQANMAAVAQLGAALWLTTWVIRRRLEIDKPQDNRTKLTRIALVLLAWTIAAVPAQPGLATGVVRLVFALVGCVVLWWPSVALAVSSRIWRADFSHVSSVLHGWNPLGLTDDEAEQVAYGSLVTQVLDRLEEGTDVASLARVLAAFRADWAAAADWESDYRAAESLTEWWQAKDGRRAAA